MSDSTIQVTTNEDTQEVEETQEVETETVETEAAQVDEETETEAETEESEEETVESKPKVNGFKKRLDKVKAKAKEEAREEIEYWKREAMKGKNQSETEAETESTEALDGKPNADDYESHEEYIEALTDFKLDARLKERDAKKIKEVENNKERQVASDWQNKIGAFAEETPDFVEVMESAEDIDLSNCKDAIFESDLGAEVLYDLAKNPEEAQRISELSTNAAIRAIGRIEARLELKTETTKTETKKLTKAPKPLTRSAGSGKISKDINDPNISQADYEKLRNEQRAKAS